MTAKLLGVQVNEFSICMGPALLADAPGGDDVFPAAASPSAATAPWKERTRTATIPGPSPRPGWWKRLIDSGRRCVYEFPGGLLLVVLILLSSAERLHRRRSSPSFTTAAPWNPQDGLQAGDEFYKIDGERVYIYSDVAMLLSAQQRRANLTWWSAGTGRRLKLSQIPDGKAGTSTWTAIEVELYGMQFATEKKTAGGLLKMAWNNSLYFVQLVKLGLHDLVTGAVGLKDMSGPVGIVKIISDTGNAARSVSDGVSNVLYLGAFIAINLAVMNLLPLPALDGGRIVCLLLTAIIEGISRKKLNPKVRGLCPHGGHGAAAGA